MEIHGRLVDPITCTHTHWLNADFNKLLFFTRSRVSLLFAQENDISRTLAFGCLFSGYAHENNNNNKWKKQPWNWKCIQLMCMFIMQLQCTVNHRNGCVFVLVPWNKHLIRWACRCEPYKSNCHTRDNKCWSWRQRTFSNEILNSLSFIMHNSILFSS